MTRYRAPFDAIVLAATALSAVVLGGAKALQLELATDFISMDYSHLSLIFK